MGRFSDIGAAVIGSGFIGTVHIENLRRLGVSVKGVLGSSPDRGAEAAARIGLPQAYTSLQELLADPAVDAVHVTSPNQLHYPQVKQILAAGRHVICEKPLAVTSQESAELVQLAAASDRSDLAPFERLLDVITRPFEERPDLHDYAAPAPTEVTPGYKTFCGT